jgi:hypothetical protein
LIQFAKYIVGLIGDPIAVSSASNTAVKKLRISTVFPKYIVALQTNYYSDDSLLVMDSIHV